MRAGPVPVITATTESLEAHGNVETRQGSASVITGEICRTSSILCLFQTFVDSANLGSPDNSKDLIFSCEYLFLSFGLSRLG